MKKKTPFDFNRLSKEAFLRKSKHPVVLVLDNIRSGHNVGAAFRVGDAFLLKHIYLCGITPAPPHPQIQKTALGATDVVSWSHASSTLQLLQDLKKKDYCLIAVELTYPSIPLQKLSQSLPTGPYALIFGHEVFGIPDEVLQTVDICVEIPQHGTKFSLNVAMCMGMVVWEILKEGPAPST